MLQARPVDIVDVWLEEIDQSCDLATELRFGSSPEARVHSAPRRKAHELDVQVEYESDFKTSIPILDMSEDGNTSNISLHTRSIINRPILVPTPPSSKRSANGKRSPSPIRKLLTLLENASPQIRIYQPGNAVTQPSYVSEIRRYLMADIGMHVVPRALEVSQQILTSQVSC
jgi:hypothetical protein